MDDKRTFLKVKIKSLAAEAAIIRKEERKNTKVNEFGYNELRQELKFHRIFVVRSEAYHTLLAYGFIRGRTFRQISPKGNPKHVNWDRVWKMIEKYGPKDKKRFEDWKEDIGENRKEVNSEVCKTSIVGSSPTSPSIWSKIKESLGA